MTIKKFIRDKFIRDNGLSLALFGLFLATQIGMSFVGKTQYNNEREAHRMRPVSYVEYVSSDAFLEATMENWESEFLQMFAYVLFTAFLFQRGSAESKSPDKPEEVDADPRLAAFDPNSPGPVKRGGMRLKIYENSLCLALFGLFLISFVLHAIGGAGLYNEEQIQHGEATLTVWEFLGTSQFWFESLQNWQSEFFSIGLMVVLSIFLRQHGSPESKPVAMPHSENP